MNEKKLLKVIMLGAGLNVMGGISSVEKLILEHGVKEVELKHIPTLEDGSKLKKIIVFAKALIKFLITLITKKVDLIHIHFSSQGSTVRAAILIIISVVFKKPVILHAHGSGFNIFYGNLPSWIQQIINRLFSLSSSFIALSNSWKKFYINNLYLEEQKIIVLPNPVKFSKQIVNRENSNIVNFLFLGRIGKRKGAFELIQAFSHIPSHDRNRTNLTIAGDGDVERARNLVTDLKLTPQVTILDWVNSSQRDALLAKSDVFVLPSYNEGLPMAMIEAMSFGVSIISTPVGGIPELISHGENGLLITPGNIKELSSAMQSLIENEEIRNSLAVKGKQSVASLDIEKYCLSLKSIYEKVV